jgi:hypothetical protein
MDNNIMNKQYKMWLLANCKQMNDMGLLAVRATSLGSGIDRPASKFILAHVQGARDETMIRSLLEEGAARLHNRHAVALFTDGLAAYRTLFPEIFGRCLLSTPTGNTGAAAPCSLSVFREQRPMCKSSNIRAAIV